MFHYLEKSPAEVLTEAVGGAEMQECPDPVQFFLHGKDVAPFIKFSLPPKSPILLPSLMKGKLT